MELDIFADRTKMAYDGWEGAPEPWSAAKAMEFVGFAHIDRLWPESSHASHCRAKAAKYSTIEDVEVKWRFFCILTAISNVTRWPKNNIPRCIAALMYAEHVLGKRVDWSTLGDVRGGRFGCLGETLTAKTPVEIPYTPAPHGWFEAGAAAVDPPGAQIPVDVERDRDESAPQGTVIRPTRDDRVDGVSVGPGAAGWRGERMEPGAGGSAEGARIDPTEFVMSGGGHRLAGPGLGLPGAGDGISGDDVLMMTVPTDVGPDDVVLAGAVVGTGGFDGSAGESVGVGGRLGVATAALRTGPVIRRLLEDAFAKHDADVLGLEGTIVGLERRLQAVLGMPDAGDRSGPLPDMVSLERGRDDALRRAEAAEATVARLMAGGVGSPPEGGARVARSTSPELRVALEEASERARAAEADAVESRRALQTATDNVTAERGKAAAMEDENRRLREEAGGMEARLRAAKQHGAEERGRSVDKVKALEGTCEMLRERLVHAVRATQDMCVTAMCAMAGKRQYELEFEAIQEEWNRGGRMRNLLLTSWPVISSMYPPGWEDLPGGPEGSIRWELVPGRDHNWNLDQLQGLVKVWPEPHEMVRDGSLCSICQNGFGPEGCYQVGSCRDRFHPQCIIPHMIGRRQCPNCRAPFHPRLYLAFGLRDYMPNNWVHHPEDYPPNYPLEDSVGKPLEWSWLHNKSELQLLIENAGLLDSAETIMEAAGLMYPGPEPVDSGRKQFFYQTLGWHYDAGEATLKKKRNPKPVNARGEAATPSGALGSRGELVGEESYHAKGLHVDAVRRLLHRLYPETREWLEGKGPRPKAKVPARVGLSARGASTSRGAKRRGHRPPVGATLPACFSGWLTQPTAFPENPSQAASVSSNPASAAPWPSDIVDLTD